jgi:hypothetical protein
MLGGNRQTHEPVDWLPLEKNAVALLHGVEGSVTASTDVVFRYPIALQPNDDLSRLEVGHVSSG